MVVKTKNIIMKKSDELVKRLQKLQLKNYSKIKFHGKLYGKNHLVLAVITDYIEKNPKITFKELSDLVNYDKHGRRVYPTYDIIREAKDKKVRDSVKGRFKRYFVDNMLKTGDGVKFAVCNQWGADNINRDFITPIANSQLGYRVTKFK